jgi:predicted nuclease of predicted toxin-antitoxin system
MKFLLDQGLPRSTALLLLLRKNNVDALHVGELGLASASDAKILEFGLLEHRVLVTLDADFH